MSPFLPLSLTVSKAVFNVNRLIGNGEAMPLYEGLTDAELQMDELDEECAEEYLETLRQAKVDKAEKGELTAGYRVMGTSAISVCIMWNMFTGAVGSGWLVNPLDDGTDMFYHSNSGSHAWRLPEDAEVDHSLLTRAEIQVCLASIRRLVCSNHLYPQRADSDRKSVV